MPRNERNIVPINNSIVVETETPGDTWVAAIAVTYKGKGMGGFTVRARTHDEMIDRIGAIIDVIDF